MTGQPFKTARPTTDEHHARDPSGEAEEVATPVHVLPDATTIFFDNAPVFSFAHGVLSITITARRPLPDGRGGVVEQEVVTGFLRCTAQGAQVLKSALDSALLMGRPSPATTRN